MSPNTIMGLFAQSPIKPLQRHVVYVNECCSHLVDFFESSSRGDWKKASDIHLQISRLEEKADKLKHEIRLKLPSGLLMPVNRTDMLELLTQQDKLANLAKDIAGRVYGRQLIIPKTLQEGFIIYLKRCLEAANQAQMVINELEELLRTGFIAREITLVAEMIHQLDEIEDDTDNMQVKLRQKLMEIEAEHSPIDIIFLYEIIEWTGGIADQAQRVGTRLELMLSRS
ncbi:hypothetical protein CF67_04106 [Candidatus Photodesmus blepharus]|uniref:Phosphate transport regulator n=1 Tax=Candidatus Photodesmus blepharonis TaxID=1179155 RepID=A0A084CMT1_9GAMM|nr:TIGR00153 family protein [Candidatus Photodesmus blepharus]KEY91110.1 hypothetical protein CF67_04106 [Candidatus Photodesmus blepharus]